MKRLVTLFLVIAMLLSLLTGFVGATEEAELWDRIIAYENAHLRRTRGTGDAPTAADYAALSGDIAELVVASDDYTEGTCTYDGTSAMFFWENADGEPQGYSPYLRAQIENGANGVDPSTVGTTETVSYAKRGGSPNAKNVYLIGPWYGSDSSFTAQYKTEAQSIARTTGGTYTLYSGKDATIDKVAEAMQSGAVVFFDSHGTTNYEKYLSYTYPDDKTTYVVDNVTKADTSYLTLTDGTGLTNADKKAVAGKNGTYYHAWEFKDSTNTKVYCVDGTVIANHMTDNAPHNMLWMAICLGMATDGIYKPLREKGVEVVYGYSQSVTFTGDYDYEKTFWTKMKNGATVAEAIKTMKDTHGNWDPGYLEGNSYYNTVDKARKYFVAFPVVVSSEDAYLGQRTAAGYGADTVQTVNAEWRLKCEHTYAYTVTAAPTVTAVGELTGTCTKCGTATTLPLPKLDEENYTYSVDTAATCAAEGEATYCWKDTTYGDHSFSVTLPKTDVHTYDDGAVTKRPTCKDDGEKRLTCTVCGATKTQTLPKTDVHTYDDGAVTKQPTCKDDGEKRFTCTVCGATKTQTLPKTDVHTYDDGAVTKRPTCRDDGEKRLTCTVCGKTETQTLPKSETCPSAPFDDVGKADWFHDAVDAMVADGLMKGVSENSFAPEEHLTRAMLVTILYRISGDTAAYSHPFTDVPSGQWYSKAVAWAYENNVVTGTDETTFSPNDNVTREQAATMLYRFADRPAATGDVTAFNDAAMISAYAVTPLRWAVGEGIINGKSAERLDPTGTATRAEIAKIIAFWLKK